MIPQGFIGRHGTNMSMSQYMLLQSSLIGGPSRLPLTTTQASYSYISMAIGSSSMLETSSLHLC